MKFHTLAAIAAVGVLLSGCATQVYLTPTGGSRSDGTVEMSYEHGIFERPQADMALARQQAAQRCSAWGYSDAQPFGGYKRTCTMPDGSGGCYRFLVTVTYQCLGRPEAPPTQ